MFNLRNLDLNLLTVFEAVYGLGNVSDAADRLALSQSAASHALSRLREVCRDDLFVRVQHGLSPTAVARAMYPAIDQALDALRVSLMEASGFDPARAQYHFEIRIPHPMGPFYALRLNAAAATGAPSIVLGFDTASRPVALENDLRDGIVDLAIDWLEIAMDPFVHRKLFDERLVLLAREDHPTVDRGVTIEDLRKEAFVSPHRRREIERLPQALRDFYELGLKEAVYVSELLEIPAVVANTDLLGVFPSSMARMVEKRLGLRILELPHELPALPIYMIWHKTRRNDAAHHWLRELVAGELGEIASE
jgi:DNA-binding transcriptional LysR family regulator